MQTVDDQLAQDIVKATTSLKGLTVRIEAEPHNERDLGPMQVAHAVRQAEAFLQHYLTNYP